MSDPESEGEFSWPPTAISVEEAAPPPLPLASSTQPQCYSQGQVKMPSPQDLEKTIANFNEISLLRKPGDNYTQIKLEEIRPPSPPATPKARLRGQLLHQSLPISCMKLFDYYILVMSEGPCLLLFHPKDLKQRAKRNENKCRRVQLFPNQLTIRGIEFVEDSCGLPAMKSPWNGPEEKDAVAFVWAGNHGMFFTLDRYSLEIAEGDTYPSNREGYFAFDYIPIAARWFEKGRILVLLSVFNYIVIYERGTTGTGINDLKEIGRYECELENLYSGTMDGDELDELVVFSGTTFKGILVWDIKDGQVNIRHKLTGHQGIPFSLEYNCDWKILLSSSDDRTVIAWSFINEEEGKNIPDLPEGIDDGFLQAQKMKKKNGIPPVTRFTHRLRMHEARVWKAIWVQHAGFLFMVSVGEDSCVGVGSYDRAYNKLWKAHDGASIYQVAYGQDNDHLYTAAHDGSVFCWKRFYLRTQPVVIPFDQIPKDPLTDGMYRAVNQDYPRGIILWDSSFIIAAMNGGRIVSFYYYNKRQSQLYYDSRFKSFSIMSISPPKTLLAVGGGDGYFVLLKMIVLDDRLGNCQRLTSQLVYEFKFDSKFLNIIWLADDQIFVVCLEKAYLLHLLYENEGKELRVNIRASYPLSLERPGIPSAILTRSKFIVAGDESGDLMLFQIGDAGKDLDLLQTIKSVHAEGVTSIIEYKSKIMTGGKLGGVKSFILEGEGLGARLIKVHEFLTPFDWVGKFIFIQNEYEDVLIGGFHKKDFIIYSWNGKRVLNEITDVGGHRRWDFKFEYGNAAFSFIRDKEVYYSTTSIDDRQDNIIKLGLHHKTVTCGIPLNQKEDNLFVATASDDGNIRVFRYDLKMNKYYPIHKIGCHASSVRALASLKLDDDRCILFSGGGRSEIYASLIGLDVEELEVYGKLTLVKPRNRSNEIDTRVMDLAVARFKTTHGVDGIVCFCACSDGSVKCLLFSAEKKKFFLSSLFEANEHSVMKIALIERKSEILVLGVTSNGCLFVWKWETLETLNLRFNSDPPVFKATYSKRIRNAALMSLKIEANSETPNEYFIALGSDDCCVSVWKLKLSDNEDQANSISQLEEMWYVDQTQRGAVIGVDIVDNLIFSCSNDQVVAKFDMTGNLIGKSFCGVPDCQGFVVNNMEDCIMCFGDGVTWISCP